MFNNFRPIDTSIENEYIEHILKEGICSKYVNKLNKYLL